MAALIKDQWVIANNEGWSDSINFWLGTIGTPDSIAGDTAIMNMIRPGRPASEALTFSSADGTPRLSISGFALSWDFPRAVTALWTPGTYDIQVRVFSSADFDRYNLVGPGRFVVLQAPGT